MGNIVLHKHGTILFASANIDLHSQHLKKRR